MLHLSHALLALLVSAGPATGTAERGERAVLLANAQDDEPDDDPLGDWRISPEDDGEDEPDAGEPGEDLPRGGTVWWLVASGAVALGLVLFIFRWRARASPYSRW